MAKSVNFIHDINKQEFITSFVPHFDRKYHFLWLMWNIPLRLFQHKVTKQNISLFFMYICIITLHSADMYPLSLLFLLVGSNWIHKHKEVGYNITMITLILSSIYWNQRNAFHFKRVTISLHCPYVSYNKAYYIIIISFRVVGYVIEWLFCQHV